MSVAYLVLVHKNPKLLERAVHALSTEDSGFFIHIDTKAKFLDFSHISGKNVIMIQDRMSVVWGEFSQVEATMRLLRAALASTIRYDYFVLLQGSDYPLRSGTYIQRFFQNNRGLEFISAVRMPAPGYPISKINNVRYASDKPVRRFVSRALGKINLAGRDYRRSLPDLQAYAGHAPWALSRSACEYLLDFVERNPHVPDYFGNAFTSDEMFFHTILGNSPFRPQMRRDLTFVDPTWADTGEQRHQMSEKHIRVFEAQDRIWLHDEWGSGEVLFARKFSDENLALIDRVDQMISAKDEIRCSQ